MRLFVDTSALYALLVSTDENHDRAANAFDDALDAGRTLVVSNYVMVETNALLQRRIGLEPVRDVERLIAPLLQMLWVTEEVHRRALRVLFQTDDRALSLVDCVSFVLMEREGIRTALALDEDFTRRGFDVLPA